MVGGLIRCPRSAKHWLKFRKLLRIHFCWLIGSPAVSGSINCKRTDSSSPSFFLPCADHLQANGLVDQAAKPASLLVPGVHVGSSSHPSLSSGREFGLLLPLFGWTLLPLTNVFVVHLVGSETDSSRDVVADRDATFLVGNCRIGSYVLLPSS